MKDASRLPTVGLVSVIVPAFNVEPYVAEALESLVRQSYPDLEIVVVDDGSSDGTVAIAERFSARDHRVRVLSHSRNRGLYAARNTGIQAATGEYVALLDADDVAYPDRIARQVAALQADPLLGMCGSQVAVLDEEGRETGDIWLRPVHPDAAAIGLLFRNTFSVCMTLRRAAIPVGGFPALAMAEDYAFNVRVAADWRVANLPDVLTGVRVRQSGLTGTRRLDMEAAVRRIIGQQLADLGLETDEESMNLHRSIGAPACAYSAVDLAQIEAWLGRILAANDARRRYPAATLRRALAAEWFAVCGLASPLGYQAWSRFWRSPVRSDWCPPAAERLRFVVKCLLRHDRFRGAQLRPAV